MSAAPLLEVQGLTVAFGGVPVVDTLDLAIAPGESLGVVGESGSGKSMTALATMGLLPEGAAVAGTIAFDGEVLDDAARERLRGTRMAMVFQEPMSSLNPVLTVGEQISETLRFHQGMGRRAAARRAAELLSLVEIPDAAGRLKNYPHQMSGGQRQRVMIAIALACSPKLLIADEPTTALDATVQAGILDLLRGLRRELGMAVMLITHDLGVVSDFAERVVVMYAGRAVERGPAARLFAEPAHPYTRALLAAIPRMSGPVVPLPAIPGTVPLPHAMPPGCRFAPRCAQAREACAVVPPRITIAPAHDVACVLHA
jgi:oligopeptide/dipeptide ABC transporter ATP-binding protein